MGLGAAQSSSRPALFQGTANDLGEFGGDKLQFPGAVGVVKCVYTGPECDAGHRPEARAAAECGVEDAVPFAFGNRSDSLGSVAEGGDLFEGLAEAGWWRQLAREAAEEHEVDYECDPYEEATEEPEVVEAAAERAAQEAMRLQTGGRAKYGKTGGELVLRRAVGQQDVGWGSAPSQARRRGSRLRRQPQQSLPAAEVQAASDGDRSSCKPAGSRFAVLAEDESEEETLAEAQCFTEAEALKELEELLEGRLRSCPEYLGSVREAASQEIEARIGWLTALASLHTCPIWQAVVAREFCLCEDVLQSWGRSGTAA